MHFDKQTKMASDFIMNQFQNGLMILHHVQDNIYETSFLMMHWQICLAMRRKRWNSCWQRVD